MNKQAILLGILSIVWIVGGSTYVGNLACSAINNLMPLELTDGSRTFQSEGHFSFGLSSAELKMDKEIAPFFAAVGTYLSEDPQKKLKLSGEYLSEELNLSTEASLGIARAKSVKNKLISLGTPANQIVITEKVLAENRMINKVLYDGVGMTIFTEVQEGKVESNGSLTNDSGTNQPPRQTTTDNVAEVRSALESVEALTLFGDAVFSMDLNPSMQHYIDKITAYLAENPKAYLQITGHTQELGSIVKNADRSLELARKARRFFRTNGINYKRIKTNAKGATEPILTPDYPEAGSKNNRVEIKIRKN